MLDWNRHLRQSPFCEGSINTDTAKFIVESVTELIVKEKLTLTEELETPKYFQLDLWPVEFPGNSLLEGLVDWVVSLRVSFSLQLGGLNCG